MMMMEAINTSIISNKKDTTVSTYYGSDCSSFDDSDDDDDADDGDYDDDHDHDHDVGHGHHHGRGDEQQYSGNSIHDDDNNTYYSTYSTTHGRNILVVGNNSINNSNSNNSSNIGLGKRKRRLRRHGRLDNNDDDEEDDDHDDDDDDHDAKHGSSGRRVRHRKGGRCDLLLLQRRRRQRTKGDGQDRNRNESLSYFPTFLLTLLPQFKKTMMKKKTVCARRRRKTKKKNSFFPKKINPQIVFLIVAGIGWTIIQRDFLVVIPSSNTTTTTNNNNNNTPLRPSSSLVRNEEDDAVHGRRYLRYHTKATTELDQAASASASRLESVHENDENDENIDIKSAPSSLTEHQKQELEERRHSAFLLRRQRLQNEINTTLFSVDDFVQISALLLSSSSSPSLDSDDNSNKYYVGEGREQQSNQLLNGTTAIRTTTTTITGSRSTSMKIDPDLKPVLRILQNAGYKFLDHDTLQMLPTWTDIVGLYGQEPKIYGLETCQKYRDTVPWELRSLGPAGSFNTGTNLLSTLLASNCQMDPPPGNRIARFLWQSPWGKHIPSQFVHNHTHKPKLGMKVSKYNNTLAVVTTRDPLTWIVSMCAQHYAAEYVHSRKLCPNLVPYGSDLQRYHFKSPNHHHRPLKLKYTPVNVKYSDEMVVHHRSMADMWNEFYGEYANLPINGEESSGDSSGSNFEHSNDKDIDLPSLPGRIIVRLEDLIFHADKVVPQICECMGATYHPDGTDGNILLVPETTNQNDGVQDMDSTITGLLRTIIKYGTPSKRLEKFQDVQQLEAAKKLLNGTLMDLFGYPHVPDIPSRS